MFKLDLEKAEEPEIKLPTSVASSKKQESSRKTSTFAYLWRIHFDIWQNQYNIVKFKNKIKLKKKKNYAKAFHCVKGICNIGKS